MKPYLFIPLAAAILLASCDKNPPETTVPSLKIETQDGATADKIIFPTEGASRTVNIKTAAAWNAQTAGNTSWVKISPESGNGNATVTLTAGPCLSEDPLSGKILFLIGGKQAAELPVEQSGTAPFFSATADKTETGTEGGDITFTVNTNIAGWKYEIENGGWLSEKSKTDDKLVLTAMSFVSGAIERKATVRFMQPSSASVIQSIVITQKRLAADMLDIVFAADGTATDISPMQNTVQRVDGNAMMVYHNQAYECYVPRFNHAPSGTVSAGYYKMDYRDNSTFKGKLADGHTLETLFMLAVEPINAEIKPFSAMEGGGTGFLITNGDRGNVITFLPHVGAGWTWTTSGVKPVPGQYYHVVGVWNKQQGKSYVYVNGELKNTVDTSGDLNFPGDAGSHWFCVGGDAAGGAAGNAWNGDVVTAKVYDAPLTAAEITQLWAAVKDIRPSEPILIKNLSYRQGKVQAGTEYTINGEGFAAGDKIVFESIANPSVTYTFDAALGDKCVTFTIPVGMQSDRYMMTLGRGGATSPLGIASLTVTNEPVEQTTAGIIAHRGYCTTSPKVPDNSRASLKAANELGGVYGSEADFYMTTDGKVVSFHDANITVGGTTKKVDDFSWAELSAYRLANGELLPQLSDYLDYMKANPTPMKLIIEIKTHSKAGRNEACADAIISQVAAAGLNARVEYIAFNYNLCVYLAGQVPPGTTVGYLDGNKAPSELAPQGINCIDYNTSVLNAHPEWIKQAHDLGMVVNVWTIVNSTSDMEHFMEMGVDFITTDYPQTMKTLLEQRP